MKKTILIISSFILIMSCTQVKNKAKETLNKGSETAGELASGVVINIKDGATKNLKAHINVSPELNLEIGKTTISSTSNGSDNKLEQYFIFTKDISDTLVAKAYNRENQEIGRTKAYVSGKKDDASYIDFIFDDRTSLESQGVIKIEKQ